MTQTDSSFERALSPRPRTPRRGLSVRLRARLLSQVIFATLALVMTAQAVTAQASPERATPRRMAIGAQIDLFPTVVSAAAGNAGYAPQLWLGIDHARLRLITAHLEPPDGFAFAPKVFVHPTITVFAVVIDYTFGDHFDGFWVTSGFERWTNTIERNDMPGRATWTSTVFTAGGGYIWRVAGNFYLDVWAGLHLTMNRSEVVLGDASYSPSPVAATGGLKIGYFFDL